MPGATPPIRLVVVNGCSMTYGDELPDRHQETWGAVLARRLGADLVNLGACAGSNHRIVRTTVERLGGYVAERGLRPDEVLYLAMWTRLNRFELYADDTDRQGGLPEAWQDGGWCRVHPSYLERRDHRSTTWYRHLQHDVGDRSEFLLGWLLLDAWLARGGYRYGYLWAFDPAPTLFDGLERYRDQLDLSRVLGSETMPYGGPSLFALGQSLRDLGPERHPMRRTHAAFADDHLYDWVLGLGDPREPRPAAAAGVPEVRLGPW